MMIGQFKPEEEEKKSEGSKVLDQYVDHDIGYNQSQSATPVDHQ